LLSDSEIKELKVAKAMCLSDLLFFTRYFHRKVLGNKFLVNFHHQLIIDELIKVANYELQFLNINMPPRYTKTELAAVMFISHSLAKNPRAKFLYITGSAQLANETSSQIKDIVSSPEFQEMFGITLRPDKKAKGLWSTSQGGGMYSATILGQITGFGAGLLSEDLEDIINEFDGCVIFDDINKIDEAEYNTKMNEKINRRIFNTALSRVNSKKTPFINIQQRAGMDDATAKLLKHFEGNPRAKSLVLPIIYNGKPLWELKHNMEDIENLKRSPETAYVFQSQYMQDPKAKEGLSFPEDELKRFSLDKYNNENAIGINSFIDTADTGTDDYCHVFGEMIGDLIYVTDVIFNPYQLRHNKPKSIQKIKELQCMHTTIETNKEGEMLKVEFQDALPEFSILGQWNSTNKQARIDMFTEFIIDHFVFRNDYKIGSEYDMFMQKITTYKKDGSSNHDDAPDACAGLAKFQFVNFNYLYSKREEKSEN
jgi:predicted phage terminase large subunit-like protein